MSEEIIKVLDDLGQRFGIAINWSSENVMPYLQELAGRFANYKIASNITWLIFEIISLAIVVFIIHKIIKWTYKKVVETNVCDFFDECILEIVGLVVFGIIALAFIIEIPSTVEDLIKAIYLPELTIIEYIKPMLGG